MKNKHRFTIILISFFQFLIAQNNTIKYISGEGLSLSTNEGNYSFNIGGYIQPSYRSESSNNSLFSSKSDNIYRSNNSVFFLKGKMKSEKLKFMLSANLSKNEPLDEAWVSYEFSDDFSLSFGQMLSFINNKELMFREHKTQFNQRSILSDLFSNSGREFGVFVKSKIYSPFGLFIPMISLSSGDGINSFGNDSRDPDKGSFKFGGRLDFYPLGKFSENNDQSTVDFIREDKLKLVLGIAGSINDGASNQVGEGHGDFILYDNTGLEKYPDFSQIYFDALLKYKGASLLIEYVDSSASDIDEIYTSNPIENEISNSILSPGQISSYLILGNQYNVQFGYLTKSNLSFDFRYGKSMPEYLRESSILRDLENYSFGISKYMSTSIKVQAVYNNTKFENDEIKYAEVLFQISF